jgi:hypothetical protein
MNTVVVTYSSLIDRVLLDMQGHSAVPQIVVLSSALTVDSLTLTLEDADPVNISDVLEIGSELLLVTAKTSDAVPVLTVHRGYYGTTPAVHADGAVAYVNPLYSRHRVGEALKRSFSRMEALGLPLIESDTFNRVADSQYIEMPAETRDVLRVGYVESTTGRWWDVGKWSFIDTVPTTVSTTGKLVRLSRLFGNDDDLVITYRVPYRWSTYPTAPTEAATITMIEGTDDLPILYAIAWLMRSREIARQELSVADEWNQGEPSRNGVSAAVVRLQWQEFYRALDEAKRLVPSMPTHRPFVPMPRI